MGRGGPISLGAHLVVLAAILFWRPSPDPPEPTEEAVVELVAGHTMNPAGAISGPQGQTEAPEAPRPTPPSPPAPPPDPASAGQPPPPPSPPSPPEHAATAAGPPAIRLGGAAADIGVEIAAGGKNVAAVSETGNLNPDYPPEAARRHEAGLVRLRLAITATGAVSEIYILRSSGSPSLDRAAAERLLTWHYRPATRDGTPVPTFVDQNVDFDPS